MKFKQITGGTEADALKKFPWLKKANFENAVIDITGIILVWEDGVWKDGVWKDGFWEDGFWEGGFWKGGTWEDGVWEDGVWKSGFWRGGIWRGGVWKSGFWRGGEMWSNINQRYEEVIQEDSQFKIKQ